MKLKKKQNAGSMKPRKILELKFYPTRHHQYGLIKKEVLDMCLMPI